MIDDAHGGASRVLPLLQRLKPLTVDASHHRCVRALDLSDRCARYIVAGTRIFKAKTGSERDTHGGSTAANMVNCFATPSSKRGLHHHSAGVQ